MNQIPPKKCKKNNWIAPSRSQLIQSHFKGSQGVIIEGGCVEGGRKRHIKRDKERDWQRKRQRKRQRE